MLGGGSLGITTLAKDTKLHTRYYVSQGVLKPGEPLDTFEIVYDRFSGSTNLKPAFDTRKAEITERLDPLRITTPENRGDSYIEEVEGGTRYYVYDNRDSKLIRSPLRWFFIPAFAFLFGAVGSFFISFRWR